MVLEHHRTLFETYSSDGHNLQDAIACMTEEINVLTSSNPDVDFSSLIYRVSELLENVDEINSECGRYKEASQCYKNDIDLLTYKLELDKEHRLTEMNNSFIVQDLVEEEKISLTKKFKSLEGDLRKRDADVLSLTAENLSLLEKIKTMQHSCSELEENNNKLSSFVKNLSLKLDTMADEVIQLKNKPRNVLDKWVEDDIIDKYFVDMSDHAICDIKFFGPAVTQIVKLSSQTDVSSMLSQSGFYSCRYAFLA